MTTSHPAAEKKRAASRVRSLFAGSIDILGPAIALIGIFILFMFLVPEWRPSDLHNPRAFFEQLSRFANYDNIQTILLQSAIVAICAIGMTFIIISGGIDLSTGSIAALCAVLIAVTVKSNGAHLSNWPILLPLAAALVGLAAGTLSGVANGSLITALRVPPFIITLGMMMILRGAAKGFAHEQKVVAPPNWLLDVLITPNLPSWAAHSPFKSLLQWIFIAPGIWLTLAMAILMAVILRYTRFGRHVIAIGSNEQTARLCGIPVTRTKISVYAIAGFFTGIAGLLQYSRSASGGPTDAVGLELDVIAAVVIGGASLTGGKGSISGAIIGALIMNVIRAGCSRVHIPLAVQHFFNAESAMGVPTYIQEIITGIIIISAVALDSLRVRRSRRG